MAWKSGQSYSADLRSREGDDVALKVCALFDMPGFVGSLEKVYLRMWNNHLQGARTPVV